MWEIVYQKGGGRSFIRVSIIKVKINRSYIGEKKELKNFHNRNKKGGFKISLKINRIGAKFLLKD